MFYQFKPTKTGDRMRPSPSSAPTRYRHLIEKMNGNVRAFTSRHPGIGKLITVLALALIGAVIAGVLFYQGIFRAQPTIFKIDLRNTLLGERITAPQGVAKQHALDLYLDSLDRAITADSIRNLETQKNKDHADAQLH
jgi:hypothetical protein